MIDFNWHSVNVQPSDATSFTVQNLSQDTTYEFYVRAKNIIGDGPRSAIAQASTKRAVTGSLAPVRADLDQAATGQPSGKFALTFSAHYLTTRLLACELWQASLRPLSLSKIAIPTFCPLFLISLMIIPIRRAWKLANANKQQQQ